MLLIHQTPSNNTQLSAIEFDLTFSSMSFWTRMFSPPGNTMGPNRGPDSHSATSNDDVPQVAARATPGTLGESDFTWARIGDEGVDAAHGSAESEPGAGVSHMQLHMMNEFLDRLPALITEMELLKNYEQEQSISLEEAACEHVRGLSTSQTGSLEKTRDFTTQLQQQTRVVQSAHQNIEALKVSVASLCGYPRLSITPVTKESMDALILLKQQLRQALEVAPFWQSKTSVVVKEFMKLGADHESRIPAYAKQIYQQATNTLMKQCPTKLSTDAKINREIVEKSDTRFIWISDSSASGTWQDEKDPGCVTTLCDSQVVKLRLAYVLDWDEGAVWVCHSYTCSGSGPRQPPQEVQDSLLPIVSNPSNGDDELPASSLRTYGRDTSPNCYVSTELRKIGWNEAMGADRGGLCLESQKMLLHWVEQGHRKMERRVRERLIGEVEEAEKLGSRRAGEMAAVSDDDIDDIKRMLADMNKDDA